MATGRAGRLPVTYRPHPAQGTDGQVVLKGDARAAKSVHLPAMETDDGFRGWMAGSSLTGLIGFHSLFPQNRNRAGYARIQSRAPQSHDHAHPTGFICRFFGLLYGTTAIHAIFKAIPRRSDWTAF